MARTLADIDRELNSLRQQQSLTKNMTVPELDQEIADAKYMKMFGEVPQMPSAPQPSMGESMMQYLGQGVPHINAAGDALTNALKRGFTSLTGTEYNPIHSGYGPEYENTYNNLTDFGEEGGKGWVNRARELESFENGTPYQPYPEPTSIGGQLGRGVQGLEEFALLGGPKLIGQAGKYAAKKVSEPFLNKAAQYSEKVLGTQEQQALNKNIAQASKSAEEKALEQFKPFRERHGLKNVDVENPLFEAGPSKVAAIKNMMQSKSRFNSGPVRDAYDVFEESPNFENLHKLKSAIGLKIRSLGTPNQNVARREVLQEWNENLGEIMQQVAEGYEPGGGNIVSQMMENYAREAGPYKNNPIINKITKGKTHGQSIKELNDAVQKALEEESSSAGKHFHENHELRDIAQRIEALNNRTNAYQRIPTVKRMAEWFEHPHVKTVANETIAKVKGK